MERRVDVDSGFEIVFRQFIRHAFFKFRSFSELFKLSFIANSSNDKAGFLQEQR